jgi:hypothetical protein
MNWRLYYNNFFCEILFRVFINYFLIIQGVFIFFITLLFIVLVLIIIILKQSIFYEVTLEIIIFGSGINLNRV